MKTFIKQLLRETLISEIGDLTNPYVRQGSFHFHPMGEGGFETFFKDELGEDFVHIGIYAIPKHPNQYSFGYSIDGDTIGKTKTNVRHYFRIIATVSEALMQFLGEKQPEYVDLKGSDRQSKDGQKDNIYFEFLDKKKSELASKGYEIADYFDSPALKKIKR
jgi:hypothetical protein